MAPWRIAFIALGMPGIIAILLVPLLHDPDNKTFRIKPKDNLEDRSLAPFFKANMFMIICLLISAGFSAVTYGSIIAWVPEIMIREYGATPLETGSLVGIITLIAAIFSQTIYSATADWFSGKGVLDAPIRVGIFPVAFSIPVAFFTFTAGSQTIFLVGLFFLLSSLIPCSGIYNTTFQHIAPPALRSRLASILILVVSLIGLGLGPSIVGLLSEYVYGEDRLIIAVLTTALASGAITLISLLISMKSVRTYLSMRSGINSGQQT
jgi:MFS family permease